MTTPAVNKGMTKEAKALTVASKFIEALSELTDDNLMPMQQMVLLVQLRVHGQLNQQELSQFTGVEKSSNSRNIAKLGAGERPHIEAGPGWLESFEDPANRRSKLVRLTPKGKAMLDEAMKRAAAYL